MSLGPLFIVGAPRSGTSLVLRLLQTQKGMRPYSGFDLTESQFLRHPWPQTQAHLRQWQSFLRGPIPRHPAPAHAHHALFLSALLPGRLSEFFWRQSRIAPWMQTYFARAQAHRRVDVLIEKTPYHRWFLPHLLRTFPNSRVIAVTREPAATLNSVRRRAREESGWKSPPSFVRFALGHGLWLRRLQRWKKQWSDRIEILELEALVKHPNQRLAAVLRGWGLEWNSAGLDTPPPYLGPEVKTRDPRLAGPVQAHSSELKEVKRWEIACFRLGTPPSGSP